MIISQNNPDESLSGDRENELQQRDNTRTIFVIVRASVVTLALTGVILNTIFGFVLPNSNVSCIVDYSFSWTSSINTYFMNDRYGKFVLLIFSSLCVDLVMVVLGLIWITFGKSWRVIITLIIFYFFKLILQLMFQEKIPEGYIWEYPGFPSLVVSYLNSNTLFYSTSVGFVFIAALEFWKVENYYAFGFAMSTLVLHIFTVNVLRANYIIDIISAMIIGHFIFMIVHELCTSYLDNSESEWFNLAGVKEKDIEYKPLSSSDKEKI